MLYTGFPKHRVLVFGDSNTFGYDVENDDRYDDNTRYPCHLQQLLGSGYTIIEEGLPGRTSVFDDPITEGLRGLDHITVCMKSHSPLDTVVIMLGTNDAKERFGCTARLIAKGIVRVAEKARATDAWRTTPSILLVCPPPIQPSYCTGIFADDMGTGCDVRAAGLSAELTQESTAHGFQFLDAGTLVGVGMHPLDGMHMTVAAHLALAQALAAKLTSTNACTACED